MNGSEPNIPDQLRVKFPNLKPVNAPPSLATINGVGVTVYGKRDVDVETQTYVKTRCFCFLFVPIFAIDAWRVADAGGRRWYFLGKEPLSGFARSWNMAMASVLLFIALGIAWDIHTSSPEYRARQEINRAAAFVQSGEPLKAAGIYRQQLDGPAGADARNGLKTSIEACLQSDQPQTVAAAFRMLGSLPGSANQPSPVIPDAFKRGLVLVEKVREKNPAGALEILNADAGLDPKNADLLPLQIGLLKQIITTNQGDTNRVVELAVIYENVGQLDESCNLLRPYKSKLGATEGARILGQKLLAEHNYADAYVLLFPYVQTRLERLQGVERSYSNTVAAVERHALDDLNSGLAGSSFYERYRVASKVQQDEMVDSYISDRVRRDSSYQRALAELKEANRIVPVTLDLGIVQLNRAQEATDPAARKAELEAAEKTFLAIRTFAGESDEYRLFLGQVYYWLGKSTEGRELFEQLLASHQRDSSTLVSVAGTLRYVGGRAEASPLAEEAYQAAKTDKERYAAATLRSLLAKDEDDRIAWLQKSDPTAPWVQVELNEARGRKALQDGNKPLAADYFRKASAGYEAQSKSSAMLNNWALVCFDLYMATGNVADQKHGMALLEEAVTMDPGNSILLHNTTHFLISRAVLDVLHDSINCAALGEQPRLSMLCLFYQDEAGRSQIYQQLRDSETMKKSLNYLDKALLLAPKELDLYSTALTLNGGFRDLPALQKLQQRFQVAAPDLSEAKHDTLELYSGAKDKEYLERCQTHIESLKKSARDAEARGEALTLEYVITSLIEAQQTAWVYGAPLDGQTLLQSALAAWQKHHSSATQQALQSAYFFRANEQLAQQNADYAALQQRSRHSVGPEMLITLVLERDGTLGDLARNNECVRKAIDLEKDALASFPDWAGANEWALFRNTDAATAAAVAKHIKENETMRLMNGLAFQFNPWNASSVLNEYWTQKMLGDEKRAQDIYQNAIHDGVPLPPL